MTHEMYTTHEKNQDLYITILHIQRQEFLKFT